VRLLSLFLSLVASAAFTQQVAAGQGALNCQVIASTGKFSQAVPLEAGYKTALDLDRLPTDFLRFSAGGSEIFLPIGQAPFSFTREEPNVGFWLQSSDGKNAATGKTNLRISLTAFFSSPGEARIWMTQGLLNGLSPSLVSLAVLDCSFKQGATAQLSKLSRNSGRDCAVANTQGKFHLSDSLGSHRNPAVGDDFDLDFADLSSIGFTGLSSTGPILELLNPLKITNDEAAGVRLFALGGKSSDGLPIGGTHLDLFHGNSETLWIYQNFRPDVPMRDISIARFSCSGKE
jgi:hypothetical protein